MIGSGQVFEDVVGHLDTNFLAVPFDRESDLVIEIPPDGPPNDVWPRALETDTWSVAGIARQEINPCSFQSVAYRANG